MSDRSKNPELELLRLLEERADPQRPRTAQVLLSNALGRPVPDVEFGAIAERLLAQGVLRRVRGGPGGALTIAAPLNNVGSRCQPPGNNGVKEPSDWSLEKSLMPPVQRYLETVFAAAEAGLAPHAKRWLCDTSTGGPSGTGAWSRPDFTLVAVTRYRFAQGAQLDTFGFELKPEGRCDVRSVHEAFAHTRFVNYAYLIWHLPRHSPRRSHLSTIKEYCSDLGVGLVLADEPEDSSRYDVLVDPTRRVPSPEAQEAFLTHRLSAAACVEIESALRE